MRLGRSLVEDRAASGERKPVMGPRIPLNPSVHPGVDDRGLDLGNHLRGCVLVGLRAGDVDLTGDGPEPSVRRVVGLDR